MSPRTMAILSFVEWRGAFQRPQHMAVGFARRGWRVFYISPGYVHRRAGRIDAGVKLPEGLRVIEPISLPGSGRLPLIAKFNAAAMLQSARAAAREAGGASGFDVLIYNDPRWADLAAGVPARLRVYDAMDDLSAYAPDATAAARMERRALEVADRVFTGTAMMADRLTSPEFAAAAGGSRGRPVRFIPCGVDAELFAAPDPAAVERARREVDEIFRRRGADLGRPLAGYFGALNERIDPELIRATLDAGWRALLIGPPASRMPRLPDSPALAMIGPRPYAELPAYLTLMDVAMIPYGVEGPNRFLYPVKALEYLAGGKPVLSSALPDMKRFLSDYTIIADSAKEWRDALASPDTLAEAKRRAQAGQAYARTRSWDVMIDEMHEEIGR